MTGEMQKLATLSAVATDFESKDQDSIPHTLLMWTIPSPYRVYLSVNGNPLQYSCL